MYNIKIQLNLDILIINLIKNFFWVVIFLSLIITYVGKKGSVMASDKRRILFTGSAENRQKIEEDLYSGQIRTDKELQKRAEQLNVSIKISDDTIKIRNVEDAIMGEVTTRGMVIKRRRIYGVKNGYQILELVGSEKTSSENGKGGIIVFGNAFAKRMANQLIQKYWKPSFSLKYMGDIFVKVIKKVAAQTPTVGDNSDVVLTQKNFTSTEAQVYLDGLVKREIKVIEKVREQLASERMDQVKEIQLAQKIINEGDVGFITKITNNHVEVKLAQNVQAFDYNWKEIAKPGENIIMICNSPDKIKIGDKVMIASETLCVERTETELTCDVILCNL